MTKTVFKVKCIKGLVAKGLFFNYNFIEGKEYYVEMNENNMLFIDAIVFKVCFNDKIKKDFEIIEKYVDNK